MDILFGKATRQLSALKNDIDKFLESSGSASLQGREGLPISILSYFNRTDICQYDNSEQNLE